MHVLEVMILWQLSVITFVKELRHCDVHTLFANKPSIVGLDRIMIIQLFGPRCHHVYWVSYWICLWLECHCRSLGGTCVQYHTLELIVVLKIGTRVLLCLHYTLYCKLPKEYGAYGAYCAIVRVPRPEMGVNYNIM